MPHLFFCGSFQTFDIANFFSSVKISLAAPKIRYLDTYGIFLNTLSYRNSVKGKNKY